MATPTSCAKGSTEPPATEIRCEPRCTRCSERFETPVDLDRDEVRARADTRTTDVREGGRCTGDCSGAVGLVALVAILTSTANARGSQNAQCVLSNATT